MINSGIKASPSKVIMPNGNILTLDDLSEEDKSKIRLSISENVSNKISEYYSSHIKEWGNFVSAMLE